MDKFESREWVEMGKMFKKLKDVESVDEVMFNFRSDTYDMVKDVYFKEVLGHKETSIVTLDLDEDVWDKLAETADAQDITMDEVVCNLLQEYIDKLPKNYKYLKVGDIIEEGDEVWGALDKWTPFYPEVVGQKLVVDRPSRRLIK